MKKKILLIILAAVLVAALFVPVPKGVYKDGGTREYAALTYKIVDWNRISADGVYEATRVYWFPNNFKSIDDLWAYEEPYVVSKFLGTVLELNGDLVLVQPAEGEDELLSSDRISFSTRELGDIGAEVGSRVEVYYTGGIMESYPAQINAIKWELSKNLGDRAYAGQWLDKETAVKYDHNLFGDIVITEIYANCFFARTVIPMPYEIKLNGTLSDDWCVGDQVLCTYENTFYDETNNRIECDMLTIAPGVFVIDDTVCYKPVIYLYPEEESAVSVKLFLDGNLTCTYPAYNDGWYVTAMPDGTLVDAKGQMYNYLYWEGETSARWDMTEGFCVRGEDTAAFLEDALEKLGLTRREANEFIVYWLPLMEQNPYNIISFQTECYTDAAKLEVIPAPDTVIRVFMTFKASDYMIRILPQRLTAPERTGFTVVEWGGTEVK